MIHRRDTEAFMDRTQSYKENSALASVRRSQIVALPAHDLAALKSPSNYFQALRRRAWMVLAIAVPLGIGASMLVLKLPPVYLARAEIEINPPEIDQVLSALVNHDIGRRDPTNAANYVPNGEARLRSKGLHERVVADEAIAPDAAQYVDPAFEMFKSLSVQRVKTTSLFIVSLEGKDPVKTKKLLETLLLEFKKQATRENEDKLEATEVYAKQDIEKIKKSEKELDDQLQTALAKNRTIGAGGRSFLEEQYLSHTALMTQHQMQLAQIHQQLLVAQLFPKLDYDPAAGARAMKLEQLEREAKKYKRVLERQKRGMRGNVFNNDPTVREVATYLDELLDEIEALRSARSALPQAPTDLILNQYQGEIDTDKEVHEELLAKMQAGIPEHQRILALLHDREDKAKQRTRMEEKLGDFGILKQSLVNSDCVRIPASVAEPSLPIKPNRPVLIALGIAASLALGIGIVCLLEHVDHSVKVPEHVTHGLVLPLLGVVPRIRRTALSQRGSHLWTSANPDSLEADAYRNVRASLLGIADKRGPMATILVTSAKAGEGKSTTALNLAATCAKAGERTLLLDIDLRRPSLADVFIEDEPLESVHGLVDVLKGELPWQRTVRHTELPNLDFIPSGDVRAIPIEILGTLELRQLLIALGHHYDRVILDGPAVLGLADCRVLGRIVDTSILVVRSGSHHLMTLHRAKAMLEQSHVELAGVVFNGLTDDMNSWSSYGYEPLPLSSSRSESSAASREPLAQLAGSV
jgi:polysaccharide biosynthesis transport protein